MYFFRNVSNYDELREKTEKALKRNSVNKRKVKIVKTINLEENMNIYFDKLISDNKYVMENLELMRIEDGIWNCIELVAKDKTIIVMADGYPYAKFVALKSLN